MLPRPVTSNRVWPGHMPVQIGDFVGVVLLARPSDQVGWLARYEALPVGGGCLSIALQGRMLVHCLTAKDEVALPCSEGC